MEANRKQCENSASASPSLDKPVFVTARLVLGVDKGFTEAVLVACIKADRIETCLNKIRNRVVASIRGQDYLREVIAQNEKSCNGTGAGTLLCGHRHIPL